MKTLKQNLPLLIALIIFLFVAATTGIEAYQNAVEIKKTVKSPKTVVMKYLDSTGVGDSTVRYNAILDYSTTADTYYFAPTASQTFYVTQLVIEVQDSGLFAVTEYADTTSLTNGVDIIFNNNGGSMTRFNPYYIKSNADYMKYATDFYMVDGLIIVEFDIESIGYPIKLKGDSSDIFGVVLRDDFSSLPKQEFVIKGFYE